MGFKRSTRWLQKALISDPDDKNKRGTGRIIMNR